MLKRFALAFALSAVFITALGAQTAVVTVLKVRVVRPPVDFTAGVVCSDIYCLGPHKPLREIFKGSIQK
jgi:hypothetical protein